MRFIHSLTLALAAVGAAVPQSRQQPACGQISTQKQTKVPAALALQCLQSVPNKKQPAVKLLASLRSYIKWQSTLPWLKNPPKTYSFAPTDILAGLDLIAATVDKGGYASEYDFQVDIYKLILSAHDGHFSWAGDIFRPFNFQNDLAARVISVSKDGVEVPRLYPYSAFQAGAKGDPVAITKINGVDAVQFIAKMNAQFSSYQDPDAQWNSMFPTLARPQAFLSIASSLVHTGDDVSLTFENGTTVTEPSYAALYADFSNITTGDDFYQKFCSGQVSAAARFKEAPAATTLAKRQAPGFPVPIAIDSGGSIAGYFLTGNAYNDTAVLAVKAFSEGSDPVKYLVDYQKTIATFLAKCRQAGKQRLVVDLSANGGGYVVAGYELFAQIFPDLKRFGATNIRRTDTFVAIAKIISDLPANFKPTTDAQTAALQALSSSSILSNIIPSGVLTPEGKPFASIDAILAPVTLMGDNFTAYQNTPLDNTLPGFTVTGAPGAPKPPPAVFKPENVVLLTDGTCGSTCTIFSYLMMVQAQVKSTAVGGRPMTGPMQGIGGVEGSQVFLLNDIKTTANAAIGLLDSDMQKTLRAGELGTLAEGYAISRSTDPNNAGGINGKNSFLPGNALTPAQFLYQASSCRFFYTAPMLGNASLFWQRAVDASWTDPNRFCVADSQVRLNLTSSISGEFDESNPGPQPGPGTYHAEEGAGVRGGPVNVWQSTLLVVALTALFTCI